MLRNEYARDRKSKSKSKSTEIITRASERARQRDMTTSGSGEWLEQALLDLCSKMETGLGLGLDGDVISGLVSYCEMASPLDAQEYLTVIFLP